MFQSTRPRGARPPDWRRDRPAEPVSIHAPAWGATRRKNAGRTCRPCFNPRARVGRDTIVRVHSGRSRAVSIHAPAWGATGPAGFQTGAVTGFNPRARVGRDPFFHCSNGVPLKFQSTRPRGARPAGQVELCAHPAVSIHAPAWGATCAHSGDRVGCRRFNPRARVGRDIETTGKPGGQACFNPRARVGRDQHGGAKTRQSAKFQSTRPRGARLLVPRCRKRPRHVSIHAPAWGATWARQRTRCAWTRFNPRARVGRDTWIGALGLSLTGFNPRARVGRDPGLAVQVFQWRLVSIHAPAWGATESPEPCLP